MADYGLKITRDGYDITSTDPRNYVFSSAFNTTAIALQGTSQQTGDVTDSLTFTITHGLSFIPFALVYIKSSYYDFWQWCPTMDAGVSGNADVVYANNIRVDSTNLVVTTTVINGNSDTITIRYYLLNVAI